jgi:hypothetical protein
MSEGYDFFIDHAWQLSNTILEINRRRLRELDQVARLENVGPGCISMRMHKIHAEWSEEIRVACTNLLFAMGDQVNASMKLAADAINSTCRPTLIGKVPQ